LAVIVLAISNVLFLSAIVIVIVICRKPKKTGDKEIQMGEVVQLFEPQPIIDNNEVSD
jgi:hypothetical protein